MATIKPYYEDMTSGSKSKVSFTDVIDACGGPNAGLVASGGYKNGMFQGHFVLPMDVPKIIKLLGDALPEKSRKNQISIL